MGVYMKFVFVILTSVALTEVLILVPFNKLNAHIYIYGPEAMSLIVEPPPGQD